MYENFTIVLNIWFSWEVVVDTIVMPAVDQSFWIKNNICGLVLLQSNEIDSWSKAFLNPQVYNVVLLIASFGIY